MSGNKQQTDITAAIHLAGHSGVFCVSGGGSGAIHQLLSMPGASKTVLECSIPYSQAAMQSYLGRTPASAVSSETALQMAMVAYQRANALSEESVATNFGLSCTAALATDRARKGTDRAFIAIQSQQSTVLQTLDFKADPGSELGDETARQAVRGAQEYALSRAIIVLLAEFIAAISPQERETIDAYERVTERIDAPTAWQQIMTQSKGSIYIPASAPCIFPGAFNPPHAGHEKIKKIAEDVTGRDTYFELSIHNVDKPCLDYLDISKRLDALESSGQVLLTNAPTFVEKARLFPGAVFAVGVDTLARIDAPRYYDNTDTRDAAIEEMANLGVSFLVFGRLMDGQFVTFEDLDLSPQLKDLCAPMSEHHFREDISSSAIRAAPQAAPRAEPK